MILSLRHIIILCSVLFMFKADAQGVHYSQFANVPQFVNPALAGMANEKFRFGLNYRNQWRSVTTPFVTQTVWMDFNTPFLYYGDQFGGGLLIINDRSGDAALNVLNISGAFNYQKKLDHFQRHSISAGIQGAYGQRGIDLNVLVITENLISQG